MTEIELTTILYQLMDLGVTGVCVYYEGGGDSGYIEYISYTKDNDFNLEGAFLSI